MRTAYRHPLRERLERRRHSPRAELEPEAPAPDALPACVPPLGAGRAVAAPHPDLLNAVAMANVDGAALLPALAFSFVAEDDGGAADHALDVAPLAPSRFEPVCFFRELFVRELVRTTMAAHSEGRPVRVHEGYLLRLLSQPPADPASVDARSAVFCELRATPALRGAIEALHDALHGLFKQLRGEQGLGIRGEQARRRFEILKRLASVVELLEGAPLLEARSLLARLPAYGALLRARPAFDQLFDLVRYERERAYAELTVQLGADGTIRALSIGALRELRQSRFHSSLTARWLGRALLWLRGYRITEGEVLDRWLDQVYAGVAECLPALLQLTGDLDFYRTGLAFADTLARAGLPVCHAELFDGAGPGTLAGLYNPLLVPSLGAPVRCDVQLGARAVTTLVTGPNSGGKTRLLQAVGLAQLLAQVGFPVPAESARLRRVPGIFASLTQTTSAEQAEGRLGTELLRIRMLFERSELGALVLVDELCSGTSPSEGEELFRLVLELLAELEPTAFVSTHFLGFAARLAASERALSLAYLQVELDRDERPTHRFVPGVATTSLAHKTAARLGVTREELRALVHARARAGH